MSRKLDEIEIDKIAVAVVKKLIEHKDKEIQALRIELALLDQEIEKLKQEQIKNGSYFKIRQ